MALSEQQYIDLCKRQIEKKFSFGNGNGHTQRDLEVLSQHIEDKTGVNISLSTLKRLWKNDFKQSPQLATLNALSAILDFKDWHHFKLQNQKGPNRSKSLATVVLLGLATIGITAFLISGLAENGEKAGFRNQIRINGPVHFSTTKTVISGVPNTVIFKYDVSNVIADSFYIQQTWNPNRRFPIDPEGSVVSNIYYESGYHRARLIANDSIIATLPLHILSEGWEPHLYYSDQDPGPIDFKNETFVSDGQLHLSRSILEKRGIDFSKGFLTRISNSQEFDLPSDNFSITTRMKSDSVFSSLCPWMNLMVVTEKHIFYVALQKKGCERYAGYKLGEVIKNGDTNDLSALGCNVYDWQELEMKISDKNAEILLNGVVIFREAFTEDFGKVVGLTCIFEGTGSLDHVRLADSNGRIVFADEFDQ